MSDTETDARSTTIPADLVGERMDKAASRLFPDYSRTLIQQWIDAGHVQYQGAAVTRRQKIASADVGRLLTLYPQPRHIAGDLPQAEALPLDLVYDDAHLIVLNKPADMVAHPATGHSGGTLVNALLALDASLHQLPRAGLVHRLDKDTTGLMVVARTEPALKSLSDQLRARTMQRRYLALVRGEPLTAARIDLPVGRHPTQRLKMTVRPDGRPAVTEYRVRKRLGGYAELDVRLETGRTHQIRVHLTHKGLPILGDALYKGGNNPVSGTAPEVHAALIAMQRQSLHACSLQFSHPDSGQQQAFSCPPPADYLALRKVLQLG
ncbi:MAG: RluA family pseudouridine synthase [Gammaproteobacteria bacterium]